MLWSGLQVVYELQRLSIRVLPESLDLLLHVGRLVLQHLLRVLCLVAEAGLAWLAFRRRGFVVAVPSCLDQREDAMAKHHHVRLVRLQHPFGLGEVQHALTSRRRYRDTAMIIEPPVDLLPDPVSVLSNYEGTGHLLISVCFAGRSLPLRANQQPR